MDYDNLGAFLFFCFLICFSIFINQSLQVHVTTCLDNEGKTIFVGERQHFERLKHQFAELKTSSTCTEAVITQNEWQQIRYSLKQSYVNTNGLQLSKSALKETR